MTNLRALSEEKTSPQSPHPAACGGHPRPRAGKGPKVGGLRAQAIPSSSGKMSVRNTESMVCLASMLTIEGSNRVKTLP